MKLTRAAWLTDGAALAAYLGVRQLELGPMFKTHPNLILPDSSTELWRYVDLAKLLFLLEHQSLWFSRLDTLGDPYEGFPPKPLVDDMWSVAEGSPEPERQQRFQVASHNTRAFTMGREALAVSCWHASPVESAAMWNLYARAGEGVAVRTTFDSLQRSFIQEELDVYGGMVRYVDFESYRPASPLNLFDWATLKRPSFSHEREFRAILMGQTGPLTAGAAVPIHVNTLVAGVYVSPAAAPWFAELVSRICTRYGISTKVCQSDLLTHPLYMRRRADESGAA